MLGSIFLGIAQHVGQQFPEDLALQAVERIVFRQHGLGFRHVPA